VICFAILISYYFHSIMRGVERKLIKVSCMYIFISQSCAMPKTVYNLWHITDQNLCSVSVDRVNA